MLRKLGVAGLVAGAALGMALAASPAHAGIINAQQQAQVANSVSNAESINTNTNINENTATSGTAPLPVEDDLAPEI